MQVDALTLGLIRQNQLPLWHFGTVTLSNCLANTACAILSVFPSTHFVSCTMGWKETGSHLLSGVWRGPGVFCCTSRTGRAHRNIIPFSQESCRCWSSVYQAAETQWTHSGINCNLLWWGTWWGKYEHNDSSDRNMHPNDLQWTHRWIVNLIKMH